MWSIWYRIFPIKSLTSEPNGLGRSRSTENEKRPWRCHFFPGSKAWYIRSKDADDPAKIEHQMVNSANKGRGRTKDLTRLISIGYLIQNILCFRNSCVPLKKSRFIATANVARMPSSHFSPSHSSLLRQHGMSLLPKFLNRFEISFEAAICMCVAFIRVDFCLEREIKII